MSEDSIFKGAKGQAIVIQVVIFALLFGWFKFGMPRLEKARAAADAGQREVKINDFFRSAIAEEPSREIANTSGQGTTQVHPQRLRISPSADDIERVLGAPDGFYVDFRQGRHLIWTGTAHKLEGSFDHDRLYCLRMQDLPTGHGTLVFESSAQWQQF